MKSENYLHPARIGFKKGVDIKGLHLSMREVLIRASRIWYSYGKKLIVTSGIDGVHSPGSLHYYGMALDFRTKYFNIEEREKAGILLRMSLKEVDDYYKVIVEEDHIHVEWRGLIESNNIDTN
jgi:hypothetical protein